MPSGRIFSRLLDTPGETVSTPLSHFQTNFPAKMTLQPEPPVPRPASKLKRLLGTLYVQVLIGITLGVTLGFFIDKDTAKKIEPIGVGFINLVKMMIAPIIFCTVVTGIGALGDLKKVGRVGLKAIIYFEVVTTFALILGLIVVNVAQPGADIVQKPATAAELAKIDAYSETAKHMETTDFVMNVIPKTFVSAFTSGEILQVLLLAILSGVALSMMGEKGKPLLDLFYTASSLFMKIIGMIMQLAPIAAFGAMAFTIGFYGIESVVGLLKLLACVYLTCAAFIFIVLGLIMRSIGLSLWKFLRYIREELLLVLGTSSSEPALPPMMEKLERLGCDKAVVGLVLPTGYSFNLDGTSIYLTMAAVFIAQATRTPLDISHQIGLLLILLLTSKGAAAVTGGGFITLSATLPAVSHIPVSGLAMLLGIDRFMSECRAITNLIGNGVATIFIANWEKALNREQAKRILDTKGPHEIKV